MSSTLIPETGTEPITPHLSPHHSTSFFFTAIWTCITCFSFYPSLRVIKSHRRHFALFIAIFQLTAASAYSFCRSFGGATLFVSQNDWHVISDVMTVTYVCLLFLHLSGIRQESHNMILRYIAFSLSWLTKLRDGWTSAIWEALLVLSFGALFVMSYMGLSPLEKDPRQRNRAIPYKNNHLAKGVGALFVSLLLLAIEMAYDSLWLLGLAHCCAGIASFCLWSALPSMDKKREMLGLGGTFI